MPEKISEIKLKHAMELVKQGKSYRKAAKAVKVHNSTIERYAKKMGIRSPRAEALALKRNMKVIMKEAKLSLWQRVLKAIFG